MTGSVLFGPYSESLARRTMKRLAEFLPKGVQPNNAGMMENSRLRSFRLFWGLDGEALAEIAQSCRELTVESGTIIIHQGQVGKELYLLERGSVSIYAGENETTGFITMLEAPTVFGEMAIMNPERIRKASVKSVSDLSLLVVPFPDCLSFLRRYVTLKENLTRLVAERRAGQ